MTESEFLEKVRAEYGRIRYGSRGVRQAKEFIATDVAHMLAETSENNRGVLQGAQFAAWLESTKGAHEKFTPKKYRK